MKKICSWRGMLCSAMLDAHMLCKKLCTTAILARTMLATRFRWNDRNLTYAFFLAMCRRMLKLHALDVLGITPACLWKERTRAHDTGSHIQLRTQNKCLSFKWHHYHHLSHCRSIMRTCEDANTEAAQTSYTLGRSNINQTKYTGTCLDSKNCLLLIYSALSHARLRRRQQSCSRRIELSPA